MSHATASQVLARREFQAQVLPAVISEPSFPLQVLPFLCLLLLQIIDALFTFSGIQNFGVNVEGNPLLRIHFETFGVVPTLISAKLIAVAFISVLFISQDKVRWIPQAVWGITGLYIVGAVIPWSVFLSGM